VTNVAGKVVVVTGAAKGLGRGLAVGIARLGGRVVVYERDREGMEKVVEEIRAVGGEAHGYECDVADRGMVYETAEKVRSEVGSVDILINNAGVISGKPLMDVPDEKIEATMNVNVLALFWMTKSFLPAMLARNSGHIVTVASAAGLVGVSRQTDYSASKHAAIGFGESLRAELRNSGHTGVKTTIVEPYYVDTGMFAGVKTRPRLMLPLLKEEYVVEKTIRAIQKDTPELRLPPAIHLTPVLRAILPVSVFDRVMDFFGVNDSMEEFVGRRK
jgi:all-trans-retinol dehydrogenase (NAD+)